MLRLTGIVSSTLLFFSLLLSGWIHLQKPDPIPLIPSLTGEVEYCLTCHFDLMEISPSHPVETFGCVICHGGERLALQAELAHSTMRGGRNPADFGVVEASCGGEDCHSGSQEKERDHIQRAMRSIQGTYAGAIANIRFTFGAQPDPSPWLGIYAIQNPAFRKGDPGLQGLEAYVPIEEINPSVQKFSENCLYCHLNALPPPANIFLETSADRTSPSSTPNTIPSPEFDRSTGCAACHAPSAGRDHNQPRHTLTTAIDYAQCNTCHNRGNYDLRSMRFVPRSDHPTDRLRDYYQPISQFVRCEWTLDCVDCHTRHEAMGDGFIYGSKQEAQYIRCSTCHGTINQLPLTYTIQDPDDIALRLAFLNPVIDLKIDDTIIVTEKGEPIWNARQLPDGNFELFGKSTGRRFLFRPVMGTGCLQRPEDQTSSACHECHAVNR